MALSVIKTLVLLIGATSSVVWAQSSDCFDCLCAVDTNNNNKVSGCAAYTGKQCECLNRAGCSQRDGVCGCGPYLISEQYFADCTEFNDVPITDYYTCVTDAACARQCVQNYVKRYAQYCTNQLFPYISCDLFGRIHRGGPDGCKNTSTVSYGTSVSTCCAQSGVSCITVPEVEPPVICTTEKADVVIVLDESGSIASSDFAKQLDFTKDLVAKFDISKGYIRVGLMTFSSSSRVKFHIGTLTTEADINSNIDQITQAKGGTFTNVAITKAKDDMLVSPYIRSNTPQYIILVTDGRSTDPSATVTAATSAHNAGIKVFAIGVGSNVDQTELSAIASGQEYVLNVESYGTLEKIASVVAGKTCTEIKLDNEENSDTVPFYCYHCAYIMSDDPNFEYNINDQACLDNGISFVPTLRTQCKSTCYKATGRVQMTYNGVSMEVSMALRGCSPFSAENATLNGLCTTQAAELRNLRWFAPEQVTVTGRQCYCNTDDCNSAGRALYSVALLVIMLVIAGFRF